MLTSGWRLVCILCLLVSMSIDARELRLFQRDSDHYHRIPLIRQALESASSQYGETQLKLVSLDSVNAAEQQLVSPDSSIDAFIAQLSPERESQFTTIYIPLDRGMAGFRLCLINPQEQARFSRLNLVSDMAEDKLKVIVGSHWRDKKILEYNGILTAHAETLGQLPDLLKNGDGHCFNRALSEILVEQEKSPHLAIENHVALIYPAAMVVYVDPEKPELAELIRFGLKQMLADGSFNELFEEKHHALFTSLDFYSRKLFFLENPEISEFGREAINRYGIASFVPLAMR